MSKTDVTLTINTSDDGDRPNQSSTIIQTDSLEELHRMLDLAGVPGAYNYATQTQPINDPAGPETVEVGAVEEEEVYKKPSSNLVRNPDHNPNNPRFSDNSLAEDFAEPDLELENVNPHFITDTYGDFLAFVDHEEAVARTADEFGIPGEAVEKVIADARRAKEKAKEFSEDFDDYNQVDPGEEAPPAPKGLKDYLSDLGAEREVQAKEKSFDVTVEWMDENYDSQFATINVVSDSEAAAKQIAAAQAQKSAPGKFTLVDVEATLSEGEVDEAYGYRKNSWEQKHLDRSYKHQAALLPAPGMYNLDSLGDHEYWGDNMTSGEGSYVVMKIDTGDAAKPRYTYCASAGDSSDWNAGDTVLTYHDQSGKERPAVVVTNFTGAEWRDPAGRKAIAQRLAQGGMDPKKKYSVRTFK